MRGRGAIALTMLAVLLAPARAAAADDTFPQPSPTANPNTNLAAQAIGEAAGAVRRRWPSCRLDAPDGPPTFTDAPVPAEAAAALGVLRRPQTQAEAQVVAAAGWLDFPPGEVLRPSLRIVRAFPDGTQLRLFVAAAPRLPTRPRVCRTRELREVRSRARRLPPQARRAALRLESGFLRAELRARDPASLSPGLYVANVTGQNPPVRGVSGAPLDVLRSAEVSTVVERRGHSLLVEVVPDGVARVEVVLARGHSPFSRRTYATAPRRTGAVVDNVVAIPVQRPTGDVWVTRQIWRAADGSEIPIRRPARRGVIIFSPG